MAMLSEQETRTLRMSQLAAQTNASLSRLSHVVTKLEKRGLVERTPCADSRRVTMCRLTDEGWRLLGYHLPDGGIGRPERAGDAYRFVPGA